MRNSFDLSAVDPSQIRSYLLANGWVEDGKLGGIASIWHRPEPDNYIFEILLPESQLAKDFKERVQDLLNTISDFEKRLIDEVFQEITNYSSDLIKIRIVHEDVKNGSIPIEDGVLLIEKAKELLSSAALSSLSKKKYFSGNRPLEVSDFIGNARLGQTEAGSYVINIISPLDIGKKQQDDLLQRLSFSRIVTTNLAKGLHAVGCAVESFKVNNDLHVFDESVEKGVSANLCDALIGLTGEMHNRDVIVSISFSKTVSEEQEVGGEHIFKSEIVPYLEKASDYLKENYVVKDLLVSGFVKKLDREKDKDYGFVTIIGFVDGKDRNITFELSGEDYLKAIHAHEKKYVVECKGDLYVRPRSAELLNNRDFRVVNNIDLFE